MGIKARLAQGTSCVKLQSRFGKQRGGHWLIDLEDLKKKHKQRNSTMMESNQEISTNEICGEATNSESIVESFGDFYVSSELRTAKVT